MEATLDDWKPAMAPDFNPFDLVIESPRIEANSSLPPDLPYTEEAVAHKDANLVWSVIFLGERMTVSYGMKAEMRACQFARLFNEHELGRNP